MPSLGDRARARSGWRVRSWEEHVRVHGVRVCVRVRVCTSVCVCMPFLFAMGTLNLGHIFYKKQPSLPQ